MSAADRAIRVSTAAAVLGVAGIAAYVVYWHAFEVVRAHGETGITARLEPATIDGLVYSSSMVVLYAARHRLPVPGLARWLLALGILATLAANVAHGWSHGPVGAAVAAWPAASLVGSYELLLWLIRTAAVALWSANRLRTRQADQRTSQSLDCGWSRCLTWTCREMRAADRIVTPSMAVRVTTLRGPVVGASWTSGPDRYRRAGGVQVRGPGGDRAGPTGGRSRRCRRRQREDVNAAAVAAYRASIDSGEPLSERKLAAMFGKTSRRWARNRIAEAAEACCTGDGVPSEDGRL